MSGTPEPAGLPVAPAVDEHAYRDSGEPPPSRASLRWGRAALAATFIALWVLTDLGPAALAACVVIVSAAIVVERRGGVVWWTVLSVVLMVVMAVGMLLVTGPHDLTGAAMAVQLAAGTAVGAVAVAVVVAVRRRRAARRAPLTAG